MKNSKKGFIGILLLIVVVLMGLGFYLYFKNNHTTTTISGEDISFQNYSKDNFVPYTQLKYASLSYPKGWVVYPVKAVDNSADSVIILPPDVSDQYLHSPEQKNSLLNLFIVDHKKTFIGVGASFQYSGHLSSDEQYKYLEDRVERYQGFKNNNFGDATSIVSMDAKIVTLKGIPMVSYVSEFKQNGQSIKQEVYEWFVKPDPQGRDKDASPVAMQVFYNSPIEKFSQETLNGVMDSINENFWENYFNSK